MSATIRRLASNRMNALLSTGPVTAEGKLSSSRNAERHGLFSRRLLLDDEDPAELHTLLADLEQALRPVGPVEVTLVERVALAIWRQRRLVRAETAALELGRKPAAIQGEVAALLGATDTTLPADTLEPIDQGQLSWCHGVIAEIETLGEIDLGTLASKAPLVASQLAADAEDEGSDIEDFIASHQRGLTGLVDELLRWCREQIEIAAARPALLALAETMRTKRLVIEPATLELFARYQTTLDGQLLKALKALREAQDWRLRTIDAIDNEPTETE